MRASARVLGIYVGTMLQQQLDHLVLILGGYYSNLERCQILPSNALECTKIGILKEIRLTCYVRLCQRPSAITNRHFPLNSPQQREISLNNEEREGKAWLPLERRY